MRQRSGFKRTWKIGRLAVLAACLFLPAPAEAKEPFAASDVERFALVTVQWTRDGATVSEDLSTGKMRELADYLKASRFESLAETEKTVFTPGTFRVRLNLNDGRIYQLFEANDCAEMIIPGVASFSRPGGDCFDFGIQA